MNGKAQASSARVSRLRIPQASEIDFPRLRRQRLERLQVAMRSHDLAVGLFFNQANIRYATGTDAMAAWSGTAFARCCVVPASGRPILFEYPGSVHVSSRLVHDVRPMPRDARTWAGAIAQAVGELGGDGERLAVDQLDAPRIVALSDRGLVILDATPATLEAREVKTEDEIGLAKMNGAIGDAMLYDFESAIRPGIREYELLAVLADSLYRRHGEGLFTRLVASGRNTNPWMFEAHDKMIMPGDLVAVDTDANGFEGYVIDVSRTFLCGDHPTREQQDAYRVAHEAVGVMSELLKPGLTYEEFARSVPRLPERYSEQRYGIMAHPAGLEDESPGIPYVEDVEAGMARFPDRVVLPGMVLCLECYAGAVGEPNGVKLEDQVLVTDGGCELLSTYPYDEGLLGL